MYILIKASVKLLCCPEPNDGVDNGGSVDRRTTINDRDNNSILLTVVAETENIVCFAIRFTHLHLLILHIQTCK